MIELSGIWGMKNKREVGGVVVDMFEVAYRLKVWVDPDHIIYIQPGVDHHEGYTNITIGCKELLVSESPSEIVRLISDNSMRGSVAKHMRDS
jgi:hypothetical protein